MNNAIIKLSACQALFMSSTSIAIATSSMVGANLSDKAQYATLGAGMTYLAVMLFSYPMSLYMGKVGRRVGFITGASIAALGASLVCLSIIKQNFIFYCASAFIMGAGMSCGQYLRFAAVEVAGKLYKGKAISYVLAGGIIAAVLGPNLARFTREWLSIEYSGAYLSSTLLFLVMILIQLSIRYPAKVSQSTIDKKVSLPEIISRPIFLVAVICALTVYGSMNWIMTATPLSMHHNGHTFSQAALVIQWHILGMFIPSLFTGTLIERLGLIPLMMIGAILVIACTVSNLFGVTYGHYAFALILLGVGWNFLYVGGTQLLTNAYNEDEKAKAQGFNDFLIAVTVAVSALTSGWFLSLYGWRFMNLAVLVIISVVLALLILFNFSSYREKSYAE